MALDVDMSTRLGPRRRVHLIRAVAAAHEREPESDALEWKSTLDLKSAKHRGDLARYILGMGNRAPETAAATFAGYGYILVGVEPGQLLGVEVPDSGDLTRALNSLVGQGQPGWRLDLAEVNDATVAVIEVDPPRSGDRIFTLRKAIDTAKPGTVFVRRQGETALAGPDEIRMLEERFAEPDLAAEQSRRTYEARRLERPEAGDRIASRIETAVEAAQERRR